MKKLVDPVYEIDINGTVWKFVAPKVKDVAKFQEAAPGEVTSWEIIGGFISKLIKINHPEMTAKKVIETFSLPILNAIIKEILGNQFELTSERDSKNE